MATYRELLESFGVRLDEQVKAPKERTVFLKEKGGKQFAQASAMFCENMEDILNVLQVTGIGTADILKEGKLGDGFLNHVNQGLDLSARSEKRASLSLTPTRMRDIAGLYVNEFGTEEEKKGLRNATIQGSHKAYLDKVWTTHETDIRKTYSL